MRVKLSTYRNNYEYVTFLYKNRFHQNLGKLVSEIAVATNIPCIVICCYIIELHGTCEALENEKNSLIKQYNYGIIEE